MSPRAVAWAAALPLLWSTAALGAGPPPSAAGDAAVQGEGDDDDVLIIEPSDSPAAPGTRGDSPRWPIVTMSGSATVAAAVDVVGGGEDVAELRSRIALRLAAEYTPRLSAALAGRVDYGAFLRGDRRSAAPPAGSAAVRVAFEPRLDAAFIRWLAPGGLELVAGLQRIRWGATTLARPFDALAPLDLRYGPLPTLDTPSLPVLALNLKQALGPVTAELLWIPFFTSHEATLFGGDWALLGRRLAAAAPPALRDAILGRPASARHRDQPSLALTEAPPMDGVTGADLGLRLATRLGGLDLAVAWALHWDRAPVLERDAAAPADASGHSTRLGRSHLVGLELAWTWDVLAFAVDAVWSDRRTFYTPALASYRRPIVELAAEVGLRPVPWLDASVAVSTLHVLRPPDAELLGASSHTVAVLGRVGLLLAWDGALRLDLRGRWGVSLREVHTEAALTWRPLRALEITAGVTLFDGAAAHPGVGWLYADNDSAYLRTSYAF